MEDDRQTRGGILMQFKLQPYKHQLKAIEMAKKHDNLGLLWEMGTGKTGGVINILRMLYQEEGRLRKTLILSPLVTLLNWQEEFGIHSHVNASDIVTMYKGGGSGKAKLLWQKTFDSKVGALSIPKIAITNYEAVLNEGLYNVLTEWQPEIIICDESHLCKNPKSKRTKAVAKLTQKAKHVYILTGTPILNNVSDVFSQFLIMDKGKTFGRNFHTFRNSYMIDANSGWNKGHSKGFSDWVARPEKFDELTSKIYSKCYRVTKDECLDLPELIKQKVIVTLGKEQKKYYEQMKRDFVTFIQEKEQDDLNGAVVAQLAITKALRLQQIVSGYAVTEAGNEVNIKDNPRLKELERLLDELIPNHKVIVWCSFRNNYKQIGELLERKSIGHRFIIGDQTLEEKKRAMDNFQTDEDTRVIVANRRAGGIGINLTAADYSIVYSRNFSLGEELQSEARNHRGGSEIHERIVKIDLVAEDTIDEHVLEALRNKQDISDRIIDMVKNGS